MVGQSRIFEYKVGLDIALPVLLVTVGGADGKSPVTNRRSNDKHYLDSLNVQVLLVKKSMTA